MTEHTNTRKGTYPNDKTTAATTTTTTATDIAQQHSRTTHRPTSLQRPNQLLQPNSRVASTQTMVTSPDQPGAMLLFSFLFYTKQGASKQKALGYNLIPSSLFAWMHLAWTLRVSNMLIQKITSQPIQQETLACRSPQQAWSVFVNHYSTTKG